MNFYHYLLETLDSGLALFDKIPLEFVSPAEHEL